MKSVSPTLKVERRWVSEHLVLTHKHQLGWVGVGVAIALQPPRGSGPSAVASVPPHSPLTDGVLSHGSGSPLGWNGGRPLGDASMAELLKKERDLSAMKELRRVFSVNEAEPAHHAKVRVSEGRLVPPPPCLDTSPVPMATREVLTHWTRADGKQLCCRSGTAVKLLWPENFAIWALYRPSRNRHWQSPAGPTQSFPALGWAENDRCGSRWTFSTRSRWN
jgi:hypothetical protein